MPDRRRRGGSNRRYPRTARLNELLRQILADELERIDDDRLELLTVTGVTCEPGMRHATVYLDPPGGPDDDDAILAALAELRPRLQKAVAAQARMKRTPELFFTPDPALRQAARIEQVLRGLDGTDGTDATDGTARADGPDREGS